MYLMNFHNTSRHLLGNDSASTSALVGRDTETPFKTLHSPRSSGCRDSRSQTNSKTIRATLFLIRGRFLSATFLLNGAALLLCGSPANAGLTISPSTIDN